MNKHKSDIEKKSELSRNGKESQRRKKTLETLRMQENCSVTNFNGIHFRMFCAL